MDQIAQWYSGIYQGFQVATTIGNWDASAAFAAPEFTATIHGVIENANLLDFFHEIARQRAAFPDLGQNVEEFAAHEDASAFLLTVTYMLRVTFSGTLRDHNGTPIKQGNGRELLIPSQDIVSFNPDGRIVSVEIVTDQYDTIQQMF